MHLKVIQNFINDQQQQAVIDYVVSCHGAKRRPDENFHVKEVNDNINGFSVMNDITNTPISSYVSDFQGGGGNVNDLPEVFIEIKDQIASKLGISKSHVFLQILNMKQGGQIRPHYDSGFPNYVTYKCNVCVVGKKEYVIHVDDKQATINERSLYTFEANLYKHWVDQYDDHRILLSYGFLLPCEELGYEADVHPRIRLANRIWKYYQNDNNHENK